MFTGIVRHIGKVVSVEETSGGSSKIGIECPEGFLAGKSQGDSICVDGCCLTLTDNPEGNLAMFDISPKTKELTAELAIGEPVHLEGSLRVGDEIGGHFVFGHVDGTAEVLGVNAQGDCALVDLSIPTGLDLRLVRPRGSVALAGVSLTVADKKDKAFSVQLIPATMQETHLNDKASLFAGKRLNFEADHLARYAVGA